MTINTALNKVAASVPECLAAGYVDTASGLRFAIREGGRTVGAGVVAKIIA